ncbi:MAG: response regulator transcription factor [Pyrinomonadaceae bacterium]
MKILIADDDHVSRFLLEAKLRSWGYEVVVVEEGHAALAAIQGDDPPALAVLDWMMPGISGVEVTRTARVQSAQPYIILLTAKSEKEDVVTALEAGADDYLTKPFDAGELRARVRAGRRIIELQRDLAERVRGLEAALANVKRLEGMLPICSYCKSVRDDTHYWQTVEDYISTHSQVQFSHGICPHCYEAVVEPKLEELRARRSANANRTGALPCGSQDHPAAQEEGR